MKKIIILLLAMMPLVIVANDTTQYVTDSNVEKLVDKYSAKMEAAVISIADSLKQPVEFVWKVIIKQQIVIGIIWLLFLFTVIILIILSLKLIPKENEYEEVNPALIFSLIILGLLLILSIIGTMTIGIPCILNPEYYAIQEIISFIK